MWLFHLVRDWAKTVWTTGPFCSSDDSWSLDSAQWICFDPVCGYNRTNMLKTFFIFFSTLLIWRQPCWTLLSQLVATQGNLCAYMWRYVKQSRPWRHVLLSSVRNLGHDVTFIQGQNKNFLIVKASKLQQMKGKELCGDHLRWHHSFLAEQVVTLLPHRSKEMPTHGSE